jgi:hypothetical protein
VLVYLESIARARDEGGTVRSPRSHLTGLSRSQLSGGSWQRQANGDYEDEDEDGDGEDMASDVQEQPRSTLGSLVVSFFKILYLMCLNFYKERNPGPGDEPGPHYESFGSSFGNFGPLPPDSALEVNLCILYQATSAEVTRVGIDKQGCRGSTSKLCRCTICKSS